MFGIESIIGQNHDTGVAEGCLHYKVVVIVKIPVKTFNKLCPKTGKARETLFGRKPAPRDLSGLVIDVNNAVYKLNPNIPAHYPSIDSRGEKRAQNGIKTLEFVYFFRDAARAEKLGFEIKRFKNGDVSPGYGQYIEIY